MGLNEGGLINNMGGSRRMGPKAYAVMSMFALMITKTGLSKLRPSGGSSVQDVRNFGAEKRQGSRRHAITSSGDHPDIEPFATRYGVGINPSVVTTDRDLMLLRRKLDSLNSSLAEIQNALARDAVSTNELKTFADNLSICVRDIETLSQYFGDDGLKTIEKALSALSNVLCDRFGSGRANAFDLSFFDQFDVSSMASDGHDGTSTLINFIANPKVLAHYLSTFRITENDNNGVIELRPGLGNDEIPSASEIKAYLEEHEPKKIRESSTPPFKKGQYVLRGRDFDAKYGSSAATEFEDDLYVHEVLSGNAALVATVRAQTNEILGRVGKPAAKASLDAQSIPVGTKRPGVNGLGVDLDKALLRSGPSLDLLMKADPNFSYENLNPTPVLSGDEPALPKTGRGNGVNALLYNRGWWEVGENNWARAIHDRAIASADRGVDDFSLDTTVPGAFGSYDRNSNGPRATRIKKPVSVHPKSPAEKAI